jgi:hypothetical protein
MSETYGPVYEAYIDAYIKEFDCSRELAIHSLNNMLASIEKEQETNED